MERLIRWVIALVVLEGGALFAQSLAGTWQGPLQASETPGDTLRVVFKISATTSGALHGIMYSIDQGGQAAAPERHAERLGREDRHAVHRRNLYRKAERGWELYHRQLDRGKRWADAQPDARHGRDRVEDSGASATAEDDARRCRSGV